MQNGNKVVTLISLLASIATIVSLVIYIIEGFKKEDKKIDITKLPNVMVNTHKYWKREDVKGILDDEKWDVFYNWQWNLIYTSDIILFNGMLLKKDLRACIDKCNQQKCYFWKYSLGGWCTTFKYDPLFYKIKKAPRYGWQDLYTISGRRKLR